MVEWSNWVRHGKSRYKEPMSVNQLSVYHVGMEMFNIINNGSSEPLQRKMKIEDRGYRLRCLEDGKVKVPDK